MKKLIIIVLVILAVLFVFEKDYLIQAKNSILPNALSVQQNRHQFFKQISLEYYGIPDFARELELVNRSLKIDDITTVENTDLIIPCTEAINKLKLKQSVTSLRPISQPVKKQFNGSTPEAPAFRSGSYLKGSATFLVFIILFASAGVTLVSFMIHRFKIKRTRPFILIENERLITDDRILLDFDVTSFEEKSLLN